MTFTQVTFLIFFPITILAYFLIPQRLKAIWLLLSSVVFYVAQSSQMVGYLLFVIVITYLSGLILSQLSDRNDSLKRAVVFISISLLIICLGIFKYFPLDRFNLFMPIGISFFTFQAISYIVDCYRGDVRHDSFLNVALFVSFFPCILSGPIQRGKNFIPQLYNEVVFDSTRVKNGLFLMLWGYFLKIVIAARLSILTTTVFGGYMNYSGSMLLIAALCYAFLIYCDFAGYSFIAIGAGLIMGFDLGVNFTQPYLCSSIADFWRRWHISLSSFFRDYVYIPLGGSRRGKLRKYINVMIVFALSGIWHGNTMNFLIWGLLNGFYQVMGDILKPFKDVVGNRVFGQGKAKLRRVLRILGCFLLLDFAWIFFAIPNFSDSLNVCTKIFTGFNGLDLVNGTVFTLGLGRLNLLFVIFAILILIIADIICENRRCSIASLLPMINTRLRWCIYYALTIMILFSLNLSTTEFIYSRF